MLFPLYILYTDDKESPQACINSKTMVKTSKHKNTKTGLFGKAWIKVTRSIICDLILSLFFCLSTLSHWLALIVLHSHVMPFWLRWRPQVHQLGGVQTMLLHRFSEAVIATLDEHKLTMRGNSTEKYLDDCRGPGFRFDWMFLSLF